MRFLPILLAPMAGGPNTPELVGAVAAAGGVGMVAGGADEAETIVNTLERARALSRGGKIGVNFFVPHQISRTAADQQAFQTYTETLQPVIDDLFTEVPSWFVCSRVWDQLAQVKPVLAAKPDLVSFTFGFPSDEVTQLIRSTGLEPYVTCASGDMIRLALQAGFTHLIVQGAEAGGHRSTLTEDDEPTDESTLDLVNAAVAAGAEKVIAAGGVRSADDVAEYLAQGATGVQAGSMFLCSFESGVSVFGKERLMQGHPTKVTRSFSGRPARGINSLVQDESTVPSLYPEVNNLTQLIRKSAREQGQAQYEALWVGEQSHNLPYGPAATIFEELVPDHLR